MWSGAEIFESASNLTTRLRLRSTERQPVLPIVPIDNFENHPAFKHLDLKIGGVLLPCRRIAHLKFRIFALTLDRVVGAPRTASYIMVRLSFVNA